MLDSVINTKLAGNPVNWLTVGAMLAVAFALVSVIHSGFKG